MIRIIPAGSISAEKGLIIRFIPDGCQKRQLKSVIRESQIQIKAMISKLNHLI